MSGHRTVPPGSKFAGPEWQQTAQKKAELILAEELGRRGWDAEQLEHLRKADPEKLKVAARLRAETTLILKWITEHLSMGATGYVVLRSFIRDFYDGILPLEA